MKRENQAILSFNEIKSSFEYLEALYIKRYCSDSNCEDIMTIVLSEDFNNSISHKKLIIKFTGIQKVKLNGMGSVAALNINIFDLTDSQMEDVKYKIDEDEENIFSFYCKSFSFSIKDE